MIKINRRVKTEHFFSRCGPTANRENGFSNESITVSRLLQYDFTCKSNKIIF